MTTSPIEIGISMKKFRAVLIGTLAVASVTVPLGTSASATGIGCQAGGSHQGGGYILHAHSQDAPVGGNVIRYTGKFNQYSYQWESYYDWSAYCTR
jgi:hypothetical protein